MACRPGIGGRRNPCVKNNERAAVERLIPARRSDEAAPGADRTTLVYFQLSLVKFNCVAFAPG
jgi:hypothetical protein